MRSCLVVLFPALLDTVFSAPWTLHKSEQDKADFDAPFNYWGPWGRPYPGIEQRQVSMISGQPVASQGLGPEAESHQQRQVTSLTASVAPDAILATQVSSLLQPRQTGQAPNQADEDVVPLLPPSTTAHRWGHPAIPRDGHAVPALVKTPGPARSEPTFNKSVSSKAPNTTLSRPSHFPGLPPPFTTVTLGSVQSFSAKPLPTPRATSPVPDLDPPAPAPAPAPATATTVHAGGPYGCQTTTMGSAADPCAHFMTTHTSTTTVYSPINCHGCTSVRVLSPMYMCPMAPATKTITTATTPYTWVSTVCEALTALSQLTETATTDTSRQKWPGTETATATAHLETTTPLVWRTSQSMDELPWFTVPNWHTWGAAV